MRHPLLTSALRKLPAPLAQTVRRRVHQFSGKRRGTYSSEREDSFVLDYFKNKTSGFYVDVGANDPVVMSNTYLLYQNGWRGVTIDPVPYLAQAHRKYRPRDIAINAAVGPVPGELTFYEIDHAGLSTLDKERADAVIADGHQLRRTYPVSVLPLQTIMDQHAAGQPIDFLTIDAEGHDLGVVQSVDWSRFRPKLVVYEGNAADDPVGVLLAQNGYKVIHSIGVNQFMESQN